MELGASVQSVVWKNTLNNFIYKGKTQTSTFVFDPLSVIVLLAMNASKPVGTKLYFGNGIVELHDQGVLQSTVRTLVGETKSNLKLLNHPIIYACKHFFQSKIKDYSVPDDIIYLFTKAIQGLDNLKHTYRDDRDAVAHLNTYINIIASSKDMKAESADVLELLMKLKLSEVVSLPDCSPLEDNAASLKAKLFIELHKNWDKNKMDTVIGLIKELDIASPFSKRHLFVAIESFMMCIHEKTRDTIEVMFDIK